MAAVIPLRQPSPDETTLSSAIEGFFAAVDLGDETREVYEATLTNLEQALPVEVALVDIDRATILEHLQTRYGKLAPPSPASSPGVWRTT